MNAYLYIQELFKDILKHSTIIVGFHMSYKYGAQEINTDSLGELINEIPTPKKYPAVIMVAPHSQVSFNTDRGEWERYRIKLFFCNTTYYEGTNIAKPDPRTKTSTKVVPEIWEEMKILTVEFMRELSTRQRQTRPSQFRLPVNNQTLIVPFSITGQDRVSGIGISFDFEVNLGCDIPEYGKY